jgi:hypothetical protein
MRAGPHLPLAAARASVRLRPQLFAGVGVLALLAAVLWIPATARADQTNQTPASATPQGYTVQVDVKFTGDAAPPGGHATVTVAPTCWWEPAAGPYTDPVAMLAWYDVVTGGVQSRGFLDEYGPRQVWVDAANRAKSGTKLAWYHVYCKNPSDYANYGLGVVENVDPIPGDPTNWVTFTYRAFRVGEAIPPPRVSPAELARVARDVMVIPLPTTNRNPKIRAAGAPTLVGLPTWFWVRDPDAVGLRANGTRTIRAQLGAVWAQLVATTSGLKLSSPAGGTQCSPARSGTAYAKGVPESNGCTVSFDKASVGFTSGYPVTAATDWLPLWTGSDGTNGGFDQLTRSVITTVPVAEVQNIVTH